MSITEDSTLASALEPFRQSYERDGNVITVWEAIGVVSRHNKRCAKKGLPPAPMPDWVCAYLATSADKIERLWLGIEPTDNRPLPEIPFDEVGKLRAVLELDGKENKSVSSKERFRDRRSSYVAQSLGFAGSGWNAFGRHDTAIKEAQHLMIYDGAELQSHPELQKEVRGSLVALVNKQESIDERSFRNRLSLARKRRREP